MNNSIRPVENETYIQPTNKTEKRIIFGWFLAMVLLMGIFWYKLTITERFNPKNTLDGVPKETSVSLKITALVDTGFGDFSFVDQDETVKVEINKLEKTKIEAKISTLNSAKNEMKFINKENFDIKIYVIKQENKKEEKLVELGDLAFLIETNNIKQFNNLLERIIKITRDGKIVKNEYLLTFSLLNANENKYIGWEIQAAVKKYFLLYYYRLSGIMQIEIDSMVKIIDKPLKTTNVKEGNTSYYTTKPKTIANFDFDLRDKIANKESINFILYCHFDSELPLFIKNNDDKSKLGGLVEAISIVPGNHVALYNTNESFIKQTRLKKYMYAFAKQFKYNLNLKKLEKLYEDLEVKKPENDEFMLSDFETLVLVNNLIKSNYKETVDIIENTLYMIKTMKRIKVTKEVKELIDETIDIIKKSIKTANMIKKQELTQKAYMNAMKIKTHPSMVILSTLPEEHKYAVYVPLYLPILLPLFSTIFKSLKLKINEFKKKKQAGVAINKS